MHIFEQERGLTLACLLCTHILASQAQQEVLVEYGDFEQWVTRNIKESAVLGGEKKTLMAIGPERTIDKTEPYTNEGGSPWSTSNVLAKISGIAKGSANVFPDKHGNGRCARLTTHIDAVRALGMVNVNVLAGGSVFTGKTLEPITSSKNPMAKISLGIPFTRRPKAIKFDYKVKLADAPNRRKVSGMGKEEEIKGKDYALALCILQKRWEDKDGKLHAQRVGTMIRRFTQSVDNWQENQVFPIHYGDITHESYYANYMGLIGGVQTFYAQNSKGKNVPILEEGWADAAENPTHVVIRFLSSHGDAYIGSPGNTLWIDNVKFVYE